VVTESLERSYPWAVGFSEEQMSIVGPPVLTLKRPSRFATLYFHLCH